MPDRIRSFVARCCSWPGLTGFLLVGGLGLMPGSCYPASAGDNPSAWETWSSESFSLAPGESVQMLIGFTEIPVRRWKLVVDGGDYRCDLNLLRPGKEELLYNKTDESRHEVSIPWGTGEELMVVLTNRDTPASFVVSMLGPPRDQVKAAYSFHVNRALEDFAAGKRLDAVQQCRLALKADPGDGPAKILYAGVQRNRQFYEHAAALVDEALAGELSPEMRALAQEMRADLVKLRAPLPAPVVDGLRRAEEKIDGGDPEAALDICDQLLEGDLELDAPSRSHLLTLQGRALAALGRDFEAVDAFTRALNHDRSRENQAMVYYHMGRLFYDMDNLTQAQGAFTISLQNGLPSSLDMQARELLKEIQNRLDTQR